jgi:hypothetical protein
MKLGDIVAESVFCSIGCITKEEDIETLKSYILYNKPVISKFRSIVIAHTKTDGISDDLFRKYNNVWYKMFNSVMAIGRPNFGHTFGFVDLDNSVLDYAKSLKFCNWAWKSTNDVLLTENIFNVEMEDASFFYLQGQGVAGVKAYYNNDIDLATESLGNEDWDRFFPQTNFYITTTKTGSFIDQNEFRDKHRKCLADPDYKLNPGQTEYKYMLAECVVRDFIKRNNLKTKHLISKESYRKLINAILMYNIVDGSHKNIFLTECGVCHYHWKDQDVIEI